uniref:J domain-containing protein n=1 Tax=Asterionellopsis glacialis TaxID=33640 RepID=A0A7S0KXT8_9STRA|mmetsp:Transcript_1513/g.2112  ORF Transcript_1513/g.2112 Transcript_1513/m.2112 type:complete len:377 (+) Transcript_1513:450-1580(+)
MENNEDPYEILGVSRDATSTQIRSAYRKLALKHHPDKQQDDASKRRATSKFAKISNAYEVLSDPTQKQQFDTKPSNQRGARGTAQHGQYHDPFAGAGTHPFAFHDPFQVFSQVFGEEFGSFRMPSNNGRAEQHQNQQRRSADPFFDDGFFTDPFMNRGFGGSGSLFGGGSLFGRDPFLGGNAGRPGNVGGGGGDPFSMMQRQMDAMQQMGQIQQQQQQVGGNNMNGFGGAGGQSSSYSFSSFSSGGGSGGQSVSTSSTTRIINGKRQTVTEKTIRKADGTIERHVETTGDDNVPPHLQLQQQQQQQFASLPPSSLSSQEQQEPNTNNKKKRQRRSLKNPLKRRQSSKKKYNDDEEKKDNDNEHNHKNKNDKPRSKS